ncbi:MAG TPA: hypothetical protein VGL37_05475 [Solirubrobacteraceae bacterium]
MPRGELQAAALRLAGLPAGAQVGARERVLPEGLAHAGARLQQCDPADVPASSGPISIGASSSVRPPGA